MSIYRVPHPDDLIECPYNKFHMIRAKRFPYHLLKCRKSFMDLDYVTCPFNARHELPRPELRYHVANCPDKALIYRDILYNQSRNDENAFKGYTGVPKYSRDHGDWDGLESSRETWDDDGETKAIMYFGKKRDIRRTSGVIVTKLGKIQHDGSSEPQLRLPRETPKVLTAALSEKEALPPRPTHPVNKQQLSSVFNYSALKTMPGIGRGRAVAKQPTTPATPSKSPARKDGGKSRQGVTSGEQKIAANIYGSQSQPVQVKKTETLAESLTALSRGRGRAMRIRAPVVGGAANNKEDQQDALPPSSAEKVAGANTGPQKGDAGAATRAQQDT